MVVDRDAISDRVESVSGLYAASWLEEDGNYREEGVCHDNLVDVLDHTSFDSQDLFFELVDERGQVQSQGLLPDGKGVGPADHLEQAIRYDTDPSYNVVFSETSEGLALHARTLSTYGTSLGACAGQPEAYYVGVVNIPGTEDYGNAGTDDLPDIDAEEVKALLNGSRPSPSVQDTVRHMLDSLVNATQLLRR
jgi:hypothetical protein